MQSQSRKSRGITRVDQWVIGALVAAECSVLPVYVIAHALLG